ncbi:MAG: acyl-CoA dehydrogenase family protein [Proteobacteria bacterium]|nr:acyl-CoA dehydrogenase family protein [Pseudomonadota bacterium]
MVSIAAAAQPGISDREHYLEKVREVGPIITESLTEIEQNRRLPPKLLDAMHNAGLFRLLLPKEFGGGQLKPSDFSRVIEEVARYDASVAWVTCQGNGCSQVAAFMNPADARRMWNDDKRAVLAWGPGQSTAQKVDGGFIVNAHTRFASGCRHASWLGTHATLVDGKGEPAPDADGNKQVRTMLMPKADVEMEDIWNVMGLRGTASDGYIVKDLFVPEGNTLIRDHAPNRWHDGTMYKFQQTNMYASGFSGLAMGVASQILDEFHKLALKKTPQRQQSTLALNPVVQYEYAQARIWLDAARCFQRSELDDMFDEAEATGEVTIDHRMRLRIATTHAIHEAKKAADMMYEAAGASVIFNSAPFERRFRDIHTVTQQTQGRKAHYQIVGSYWFGNEPDLSSL